MRLVDTCTYWPREAAVQRNAAVFRDEACQQARRYASETGIRLALPPAPARGDARVVWSAPASGTAAPPAVYIDDCSRMGLGSIAYRECRGREHQRLVDGCRTLRRRSDRQQGEAFVRLSALRDEVCLAADHYRVMR